MDARMIRYPDVSQKEIAFVSAGDLWLVKKTGGTARLLASGIGEESFPRFSPDGSYVAFSANYEGTSASAQGGADIYVAATDSGAVRKLTHHPAPDRTVDWFTRPDGREEILFASTRESGSPLFNQLFTVSPDGGLPTRLPIPFAEFGAVSPDGRRLAFQYTVRDFRPVRGYRGGHSPRVFLYDFETQAVEPLLNPASGANESHPMWHPDGGRLFFLSDLTDNKHQLWMVDLRKRRRRPVRLTDLPDDLRFPAIGPKDLVFQSGPTLYRIPLRYLKSAKRWTEKRCLPYCIDVEVPGSPSSLRAATRSAAALIHSAALSPDAGRVLYEARGEVFVQDVATGSVLNLSRTSGEAARHPVWLPDGEYVAYWSDVRSDDDPVPEYQLVVQRSDGSGERAVVTRLAPGYRYRPFWSPSGNRLAFVDERRSIQVLTLHGSAERGYEVGRLDAVDRLFAALHAGCDALRMSWSPDGRWLFFSRPLLNLSHAIFAWDATRPEVPAKRLTSGYDSDGGPVFDAERGRLYFVTDRSVSQVDSGLDETFVFTHGANVAEAALAIDELENLPEDGLDDRVRLLLAVGQKEIGDLQRCPGALVWVQVSPCSSERTVQLFDLGKRTVNALVKGAFFEATASASAERVLVGRRPKRDAALEYAVVGLAPDQEFDKPLPLEQVRFLREPRDEWRQIFYESWRLARDFHLRRVNAGTDERTAIEHWKEARERHEKLLDLVVNRLDLDAVLDSMLSELGVSHVVRRGGDVEEPARRNVGMLGVDFAYDQDAKLYRFDKILRGGTWDRVLRSPLLDLGVAEGSLLEAVNGVPVTAEKDPWTWFEGLAGKPVVLRVRTHGHSRPVSVTALTWDDESRIRTRNWVERKARRVADGTNNRAGYVYLSGFLRNDLGAAQRQFRAYSQRQGIVFDVRFNPGGRFPDFLLHWLTREAFAEIRIQAGSDEIVTVPFLAGPRHRVLLVNGWTASAGETLAWLFKRRRLGEVVGSPTMGAGLGRTSGPLLVDGGAVVVPDLPIHAVGEEELLIEGEPVAPDKPVPDLPEMLSEGADADPQLDRAIKILNRMLGRS
jgi:tricorn protease